MLDAAALPVHWVPVMVVVLQVTMSRPPVICPLMVTLPFTKMRPDVRLFTRSPLAQLFVLAATLSTMGWSLPLVPAQVTFVVEPETLNPIVTFTGLGLATGPPVMK